MSCAWQEFRSKSGQRVRKNPDSQEPFGKDSSTEVPLPLPPPSYLTSDIEVGSLLLGINIFGEAQNIDNGMADTPTRLLRLAVMTQKDPAYGILQFRNCEVAFPQAIRDFKTIR